MGGCYFLLGSNLEKYGKFWKNGRFSGRIWPDCGNTTRADLAGLGSIGLMIACFRFETEFHFEYTSYRPNCTGTKSVKELTLFSL